MSYLYEVGCDRTPYNWLFRSEGREFETALLGYVWRIQLCVSFFRMSNEWLCNVEDALEKLFCNRFLHKNSQNLPKFVSGYLNRIQKLC